MPYTVQFMPSADRDLAKIPNPERRRIIRKAAELANAPRPVGVKKLAGAEDLYRIRVGPYRVLYRVEGRTVTVARVRHRREAYRP